jgi:hypothetical protein
MIKGMVEEMNRYCETPSEVVKFLNARPGFGQDDEFTTEMKVGEVQLSHKTDGLRKQWTGNPAKDRIGIVFRNKEDQST